VDCDADVEVMEFPHIFRSTVDTLPKQIPYLHVEALGISTGRNLKVGLVWKAGDWDHRRNISFPLLKPLFDVPGSDIFILQGGAKSAGWEEGVGIYPGEFSLYDYANVVRGLDLLISIDSMPAHLAGALGVPVWNLLHADADWRWMRGRNDSPWYPTMRLFRQERQDDWQPVIERVRTELAKMVGVSA
jgi:hypothetical protein